MLYWILSILYFFLPAYIANMTPPLAKKLHILEFLNKPIDNNKKLNNLPILGSHKTWRGAILEIVNGLIVVYIQLWLYQFPLFERLSLLNYQTSNIFLLGFLLASGAVLGDLLSAFLKRRLRLKPGARFMPLDQTNYVIGAYLLLFPFPNLTIRLFSWIILFFLTFFLHIGINLIGYYLGLHHAKW